MAGGNRQAVLVAGGFSAAEPDDNEPAAGDSLDLRNVEKLSAREVAVAALSPGLGLRHSGTNAAHVQVLADASGAAELPPILVQEDGWRVIDGLHRLEAAKLRGGDTVKARFVDCTDSEALVLAMKANSSHGLPLSKADRVFGAKRVLAAHPHWSDRAIATITGLSAKTIASLRTQSAGGAHLGSKRLGRDGKRRPVTAGEGRRRVAEYVIAHPGAPLRQVARETDVSLGTVHDVCARLRRGADPERNGHRAPAARPAAHPVAPAATVAPAAEITPLCRKTHSEPPPAWAQLAAKMANDPTIRYTEGGKKFLRWMSMHAAEPQQWREFINAIPAHWFSVLAPMVDSISQEWALFALQLKASKSGGGAQPTA
jgi:ParB/Sulfiredoxin domain